MVDDCQNLLIFAGWNQRSSGRLEFGLPEQRYTRSTYGYYQTLPLPLNGRMPAGKYAPAVAAFLPTEAFGR